jgi:hypothetical protein
MSNVNLNETAPTQFQDIGGVNLAYRHFGHLTDRSAHWRYL